MKLDLINSEKDREIVMRKENKPKLLDLLRKFGNVVDYMTEPMVARFFGVAEGCILGYGTRNGDELAKYGYKVIKGEELRRYKEYDKQTGCLSVKPNARALRLYPIEAVVVIGMMLTESKVAEDLRNEIINELFGVSVNKEKQLAQELGIAIANGDMNEVMRINTELFSLKNKQIKILEDDINKKNEIINGLVENTSIPEKRQRINEIIQTRRDPKGSWNLLYDKFDKKYHMKVRIRAKNRGYKSYIDYIEKEEGKIDELFRMTIEIFETNFNDLVERWSDIINNKRED